jgi:hypothetical protein
MVARLILAAVIFSSDGANVPFTRVRAPETFMIELVREGYERSPAFRELVDTLQRSNVIVVVAPGLCAGGRIRSCVVAVAGSARDRQIRIKIDTHASHDRLIATIAHELQHAVEIAERADVTDGETALRLYREIGLGRCREGLSEECETARALATETKVLDEISRGARP